MSTERELLEEARWALAQSLRQWAMYANEKRHEPDDVDLGNADTHEDHFYSRAMSVLKRLGAAADKIEDALLTNRTAFVAAPCSETRRDALLKIKAVIESGWAGVNKLGNIVDRREHPDAVPIAANKMFNTPEPKSPNDRGVPRP